MHVNCYLCICLDNLNDCMICAMGKAVFRIFEEKGLDKPCSWSAHSFLLHR